MDIVISLYFVFALLSIYFLFALLLFTSCLHYYLFTFCLHYYLFTSCLHYCLFTSCLHYYCFNAICLRLVINYIVTTVDSIEVEELKRHLTFTKVLDAFGCLGVLQIGI